MSFTGNLRSRLKQVPAVYALNAAFKGAALSRETRRVDNYYARRLSTSRPDISLAAVRQMVIGRAPSNANASRARRPGELRIFCVGTYYEQENSGFLQALAALGPTTCFENDLGEYGLRSSPLGGRDGALVEANGRCLARQLDHAHRDGGIDVLIGTIVAQSLSIEALQHVRALGIPVVNIAMDDRLPEHWRTVGGIRYGAIGLAEATDSVLQTTPEDVARYVSEGCPAMFWPFGSDPDIFKPASRKKYDVAFVGNNYGWRGKLVARIKRAGIHVECFGQGFPNGHISAARVGQVFGEAKIVLGVGTVGYSKKIVTLKLRDFDGPMSGSLYMTTENADLRGLYEVGREIELYSSVEDCIRLLRHYLAHEEARDSIGRAGRARALRDHTWDRRFDQVLELLGVNHPVG